MKIIKRILLIILCLLAVAQFIRPRKNYPEQTVQQGISKNFTIPADVQLILRTACYDCHSDSTRYPWYAEFQPAGWWLNNHIREGKRHLNFSEFSGYRLRRQYEKFDDIITEVREGGMPLPSYTLVHMDARLTDEQRNHIVTWARAMMDTMQSQYPADSLVRKGR